MDAYGTDAGFFDYFETRGVSVDSALIADPSLVAGLRLRASEWLDAVYGNQWGGYKRGEREQVRDWPRFSAYDINDDLIDDESIPVELERATYEAAAAVNSNSSILSANYTPSQFNRVSIDGALSVDFRNFSSSSEVQTKITIVEQLLHRILNPNGPFGAGQVNPLSGPANRG